MFALLSRLLPNLSSTLTDFPVPSLVSMALFAYVQLEVGELVTTGFDPGNQVYLSGAAAFIASGAAHYFGRGRGFARSEEVGLALSAALGVGGIAYFDNITQVSFLFLFAGLIPVLMVAAFLRADATQGALWVVNLRLGIAALLATVAGIVFAGGLSAIAASLDSLFETKLPESLYTRIWATAMTLVSPIYGLSLAPRELTEEVDVDSPPDRQVARGVSVLVNYVLVPIVVVYASILHAYAVKIGIDGTIPKNQIGMMVTIFALGGSGTWLIAWPWRERGPWLVRTFVGGWFWFTVIPVILLAIAIWKRVEEFGVTPERYGITLVAVWLLLIASYMAFWRARADMRVILGAFAILMLLGAAGRWGANGVTSSDQYRRLVALLDAHGALSPDGRFVRPTQGFPKEVELSVTSIITTIDDANGLDQMRPLFDGQMVDPFRLLEAGRALRGEIASVMGMQLGREDRHNFYFTAGEPIVEGIAGPSRLVGPIELHEIAPWVGRDGLSAAIDREVVTITVDGRTLSIPGDRLRKLADGGGSHQSAPVSILLNQRVGVIITMIRGYRDEGIHVKGASFWLLLTDEST